MSDTILDLASDLALAQARRAEICRKAGSTRSELKSRAARANGKLNQRSTEQRRADAAKGKLSEEQYKLNAFRAWATRRDKLNLPGGRLWTETKP
jgi:hypothetical protein